MNTSKRRPPNAGKGRKLGVKNKITVAVAEALNLTFEGIGGVPGFIEWAKKNRGPFYRLFVRQLPLDGGRGSGPLVNINFGTEPIQTAEQAAAVYEALCRDASFDASGLTFAVPESLPAALAPAAVHHRAITPIAQEPLPTAGTRLTEPVDGEEEDSRIAPGPDPLDVWRRLGE
jgi:hypothetical protein